MEWHELLIQLAAIITAITTVGGSLLWIYKRLVLEPDKKMAQEIQRKSNEELRMAIEPLSRSIEMLNHNLEEGNKDRNRLNKISEQQEVVLADHEVRLSILEEWRKYALGGKDIYERDN